MVMRAGGHPMWRRISGNAPWPMAPKPTKMMRPGKSLKCNCWVMMLSVLHVLPASAVEVTNGLAATPQQRPARTPLLFFQGRGGAMAATRSIQRPSAG